MNKKKLCLIAATVLAAPVAFAESGAFAIGVSGGTLGLGVEAVYGINDHFNVRGGIHNYDYSVEIDDDDDELNYEGDLTLDNLGLGIDYHPWAGSFRLSAGVQISDNRIVATAICDDLSGCDFGDQPNVVPNGDSATVDIDLTGTHPYLTFGWGNAASNGMRFGFFADIGVMFQGSPTVTVTASCSGPGAQQICDSEAADEEDELQEDADDFEVYPIVNLGLRWRFK